MITKNFISKDDLCNFPLNKIKYRNSKDNEEISKFHMICQIIDMEYSKATFYTQTKRN